MHQGDNHVQFAALGTRLSGLPSPEATACSAWVPSSAGAGGGPPLLPARLLHSLLAAPAGARRHCPLPWPPRSPGPALHYRRFQRFAGTQPRTLTARWAGQQPLQPLHLQYILWWCTLASPPALMAPHSLPPRHLHSLSLQACAWATLERMPDPKGCKGVPYAECWRCKFRVCRPPPTGAAWRNPPDVPRSPEAAPRPRQHCTRSPRWWPPIAQTRRRWTG
mmetsp:Transcript_48176/g.89747  ORF Transcript_48176/g.89747 Transcript_48176/m.89747 type:complete len:221 (-) Transcript_48176:724-1386(-)